MVKNKVTILGAGESGTGAALLAKAKGYDVFVSDAGTIKDSYKAELIAAAIVFEEGVHSQEEILSSSIIIKSPGIPEKADIIQKCKAKQIEIIDEIEFASSFTQASIIAITGTNGKTTTTLLTYHLLKEAGFSVGLAGNVGHSLAKQVIEDSFDYYVVEMSSFQLDGTKSFKPFVGVLLNITPDHLDRYNYDLSNYVDSKFGLIKNMNETDHFIFYSDDELVINGLAESSFSGVKHPVSITEKAENYLSGTEMNIGNDIVVSQAETTLRGPHNAINMMSAIRAAMIVGVSEQAIRKGLKSFKNAPHRLEYVATINEVDFINDSKATNVDSVKYALDSFSEQLIWIAGGVDKGNDYNLIMERVNAKVKALICLGKDNTKLREAFHDQIIDLLETVNIKDAVRSALQYAEAHDVVLLSPACASFDLFNNYIDRGDQFKKAVLELKEEFESKKIEQ
ncbi:UDP-N-acetylmuramoyl-L-alanine--D-glutamate ligase [Fulvivirga sediminis]|uniref:UDP-N-acetylmuramoylalanine--D-glutamate ligase n=1 Tax=Fulvivirga sediminis TaxID=2803949 RepID=A0A937K1E1_9BACT|nr:UDP-N-acetylmuramoyl-L-alanine--D-glutamate ligase [Fulvivirga sediminis]MBL3656562.1 UDP-N-acetylmuramoyl-L-alanine--D-glutamate ligase [Fulvivirga sediminis]